MPSRPVSPPETDLSRSGMGVVAFLYGTAGAEALPGRTLIALLGELGVSERAARSALARHRTGGMLRAERQGRQTTYHLAGSYLARFRRAAAADTPPAWEGRFACLFVEVPEERRTWRDALRRECYAWGYGQLHPGVWAHVTDHAAQVLAGLPSLPPGATVAAGSVAMAPEEMRARAATMWHLPERSVRYEQFAAAMRAATPPTGAIGPGDLRRYVQAFAPFLQYLVYDPNVPPELAPKSWSRPAAMSALADGMADWLPPLRRYITGLPG